MPVLSYPLFEQETGLGIKFYFISIGNKILTKAIDYSYVTDFEGKRIYNLAFGDYDANEDKINDSTHSENGDVFKVFYTVLGSIQYFFEKMPNVILMVTGSDSKTEFAENCFIGCAKGCSDSENCKNKHRRIGVYRNYVNKNYIELSETFAFKGGISGENDVMVVEDYQINKDYDAVFVNRK